MTFKRSNPAWSMAMIAALFVTACNPILTESKMPDPGVESAYNCCEKIAFVSDREGNKDIYIMDTDGSNVARLTDNSADDYSPYWSPGGNRIMFLSDRNDRTGLYVMNADGSNVTLLLGDAGGSGSFRWSPDGKRIAYYGQPGGNVDIYVMNADGSSVSRLTDHPKVDLPSSWSPDASQIAFYSNRDGDDIYLINVDGSGITRLTHHPATDYGPVWSPKGGRIVFLSNRDGPAPLAQSRSRELLDLFQLTDKANSEVDMLSGGMRRRLLIARALLHSPAILILDEPTTGLDPQAKHLVWQKLRLLKAQGTTMLLTTHNMEEAAILCNRLVIMDYGRILVHGIPAELVTQHVGSEVSEVRFTAQARDAVTKQLLDMNIPFQDGGDRFYVYSVDGQLLEWLASDHNVWLERRPANLEDVFFRLTGRDLRDE